ncbi:MAG: hypothetical protein RJA70_4686 [Pseudomonadota bacterium]|jgi:hypothetical protein
MSGFQVPDSWQRLPSTESGSYYRVSGDLIAAVPKPGYQQSAESARRSMDALDAIAALHGRKVAVIVLVDRVVSQDSAARRVWSIPRPNECRCAQALVCSTLLARAIGSFFLGLNRGVVPTRMFADVEGATRWANEMLENHGGTL